MSHKQQCFVATNLAVGLSILLAALLLCCTRTEQTSPIVTREMSAAQSPTSVQSAALSPPGKLLYTIRRDDQYLLCYIDQGLASRCPLLTSGAVLAARWSPEGSHLAYSTNAGGSEGRGLWLANLDGGEQVQVVDQVPFVEFSWEPDSLGLDYSIWGSYLPPEYDPVQHRRFVMNVEEGTINPVPNHCHEAYAAYTGAGGDIVEEQFLDRCRYHQIQWSPSATQLAIRTSAIEHGEDIRNLYLICSSTNRLVQVELPEGYNEPWIEGWSPDGRWLVVHASGGDDAPPTFLLDSVTLHLQQLPVYNGILGDGAYGFVWSPDGEWLAFLTTGMEGQCVSLIRRDGSEEHRELACNLLSSTVLWSPDSRWIAFECRDRDEDEPGTGLCVAAIGGASVQRLVQGTHLRVLDWQ